MKQKLNAWFIMCMTLAIGTVAWAAGIASSATMGLSLDTRTERMIAYNSSGISLPLAYSANGWGDGEAAGPAKLSVTKENLYGSEEETIADNLEGNGSLDFTPTSPATYTFSHTDGNGETLTAPITIDASVYAIKLPESFDNVDSFVVSNETQGAQVTDAGEGYKVCDGDTLKIYFQPAAGYFVSPNPFAIENITADKEYTADELPKAGSLSATYYLSFTAKGGSAKIKLAKNGSPDELLLETSSNGTDWDAYDPGAELADGATVYFRRKEGTAKGISQDSTNYYTFQFDAGEGVEIYGGGTVMSLADGVDYASAVEVAEYGFFRLFAGATNLVTAPQLTATTLGKNCYSQMFNGCTKLERVVVSFTGNWPAFSTVNWLNGVSATGVFIGPKELNIGGRATGTVPRGWKASYPTVVTMPAALDNAVYTITNGKHPISGSPTGDGMIYVFGRAVEDIVVTVTPNSGYMVVEQNPLVIPPSTIYVSSLLDITTMIPKVMKVEWTVGHDAAHGATTNEFICLCDALADLHDNDTLTYCGLSNSIPTDCDFVVSNKNVTVDLANKLLEEPLTVTGLPGGRDSLGGVRLVNGTLTKGVLLNYGCLTLVDGSTVTNTTADAATIVCSNTCNELKFDGATTDAILGLPKIAVCGLDSLVYTKPAFTIDTEIVAVPSDELMIMESGNIDDEDHYYMAGFAKVVNSDTGALYFTILEAMKHVKDNETLTFRTNIAESVWWDWTRAAVTNVTIDLDGYIWSASTDDANGRTFTLVNGGWDVTIYNGSISNEFDCSGGKITFSNLKTVNNVDPKAPDYTASFQTGSTNENGSFNGQITIDRGTYNNMASGVIDGLEILRGRFSADYEELGHFNSQEGKFAFMRQDTRDWLVVPTNDVTAWVVSTNGLVRRAYNSVELAMEYANTNETIEVMKDIDHKVVLPERYIYKMLKFRNSEHLVNGIAAERHNESYEFKDNGDGTYSLLLKDMRSRKLTFLIEGRGKAWADGVVSKHVKDGTQTVECYSELTPNVVHKLKAVAEPDGGHVFWRWEYEDGTKLHGDEYELNPYAEEIDFVMPPTDMTIRLVFKSPTEVSTADVTVLCSPNRHGQVYLDGIAGIGRDDPSRYEFYKVKNGDHTIKTETSTPWRFTGYTTNAVTLVEGVLVTNVALAAYDAIWDDYVTRLHMPARTVTAHFINNDVFSATGHDAEKVFDGRDTNITVDVTSQAYDHTDESIVYYSSDLGETWSAENPRFRDVGFYPVLWQVKYGDWADGFDEAGLPGSLIAEGSNSVTITAKAITDFLAYIVKPLVADDEGVKVIEREPEVAVFFGPHKLVEGQDYDLAYGPAAYGTNTVTITGKGNYAEEVTLEYEILVKRTTDHLTYYVCTVHTNAILASADADAGSSATGYDGGREIRIPAQFTPEKIGGVPEFDSCEVSAILAGAFTNIPKLVRIKIDAPLKIYGNMIQGLEDLEYIDFWGATPADCPYYFYKLGADDDYGIEKNGVGVLVERAEVDVDWIGDLTLLGIADAADTFKVPAQIKTISASAFAGNPLLREVELHNGITAIKPGLDIFTDMQKTVFTIQGEPSDYLKFYFMLTGYGFVPYPMRPGWFVTFNWNEAEARIGDRGFYKFTDAVAAARDGETVVILRNLDDDEHDHSVEYNGKRVIFDGTGTTNVNFTITTDKPFDQLRVAGGTFDVDYRKYLVMRDPALTMWKWFDETRTDTALGGWLWTVVDVTEPAVYLRRTAYRSIADAMRDATTNDVIEIVRDHEEDYMMPYADIYKTVQFHVLPGVTLSGKIGAVRHDEFYEFKELIPGSGFYRLMLKPTESMKLTFEIEGRGSVLVDGKDPGHLDVGGGVNTDYIELKPLIEYTLTAVPNADGLQAFWRWEDAFSNRLYFSEMEPINPYKDKIKFVMPPAATKIRLVFLPKEEVTDTTTVKVTVEDKWYFAEWIYLDTVRAANKQDPWTFTNVRNGDHVLTQEPNLASRKDLRFVCWVTNNVVASYNPVFTGFQVEANAPEATATLRYITTNFWAKSANVTKAYDRAPASITVEVHEDDYTKNYTIEYSADEGATWSEENPAFTEAGFYRVFWHVRDGQEPSAIVAGGLNLVTILRRPVTADWDVFAKLLDEYVTAERHDDGSVGPAEPRETVWYDWQQLVKDADYTVSYVDNDRYTTAKVVIEGQSNYCGRVKLPFEVLQYGGPADEDGCYYYLDWSKSEATLVKVPESDAHEYDVTTNIFTGGTTFQVKKIAAGAFKNMPNLKRLRFTQPVEITGNILEGLEKLEYIDFWDDAPYYFKKLGENGQGAGVLFEFQPTRLTGVSTGNPVRLLGVVDAADTFAMDVRYDVGLRKAVYFNSIASTAFAGNPRLCKIVLNPETYDIGLGVTKSVDMHKVVFMVEGEPNGFLANYFKCEGWPLVESTVQPGWYVTFVGDLAEAQIVTVGGEIRQYYKFTDAMAAARDGETITLLKNITNANVFVTGKNVNIAGGEFEMIGCEFKYGNGDGLRILSGTYDQDLRTKLTYPETDTMEKWFVFDGSYPSNRWTVIKQADIVCTMTNTNGLPSVNYRTLNDAAYDSKGGETLELIKAKGVTEDVIFTHDITFLGSIEGRRWKGLLTAADGAIVLVKGTRAAKDGNQKFEVAKGGTVQMDYFAGQCAVADPEKYSIVRVGPALWQLLLTESVVAIDLDNPEDRYYDIQLAADNVAGRVLVIKDNDQAITATRDFTLATEHTADNIAVYGGALTSGAFKVSTLIGSTFGKNYGNDLYFYPDQALANLNLKQPLNGYANVWCVVPADKIVAELKGCDPAECFTSVEDAADQAEYEDIIIVNKDVDTVTLTDANIYKHLKFTGAEHLTGDPKVIAERHSDFYEFVDRDGDGSFTLELKDMPTKKLTFVIEGKGSVLVNGKAAQHVELYSAYSELKPGEWYELKAVPTLNGGDAFLRWENADKTRLAPWTNNLNEVNCAYDDVIRFQMLNEDMTLRLVFDKAENVTQTTLKILPDNSLRTTSQGQVYLDGKKKDNSDNLSWTFMNVKPGEHTLYAEPNGPIVYNRFVCWIRDGETVYANPYTNFEVADTNYIEMVARFMTTNFVAWAENAEKIYDGEGTNITVHVDKGEFKADWHIEYLNMGLDGATWSEENPVFVTAGKHLVAWRVCSSNYTQFVVDGTVATIAEGEATVKIDPASLTDDKSLVYIGLDRKYITLGEDNPKVIGRYLDFALENGVDFDVEYPTMQPIPMPGEYVARVTGKGNYQDTVELPFELVWPLKPGLGSPDGNTYYVSGIDFSAKTGTVILADVAAGSCAQDPHSGKYEYQIPTNITATVMGMQVELTVVGVAAGAFDNIPEVQRILFPVEVEIYGNIIRGLENLEYIDFWGMDQQSWDADYKYKKLGEEHGGAGILLKKPVTNVGPFAADPPLQPYDRYDFNGWELIGVADAANVFSVAGGFDLDVDMHVDIDAIGADAFYGNKNLIEIALTNGVKWLQPGLIEQSNIDTNLMFFSMNAEPTEEIKNFFAGEGLTWIEEPEVENRWTTFNWGVYEARIVNYSTQEKRGYYTLVEAFEAATDGQTVEVMRDLDGEVGHSYMISGKAVVLDAKDRTLTNMKLFVDTVNGGELRILAGTFGESVLPGEESDYQNLLQAGKEMPGKEKTHWFADPVFKKWYAEGGFVRYTVVEREDYSELKVKLEKFENGEVVKTDWFGSLADANLAAVGDGTEKMSVWAPELEEDVTLTKEVELVFDANHLWRGTLTAQGAKVTVTGVHDLFTRQLQHFAVEGEGATILFNYYPGLLAPADTDNYCIARFNASQWTLVLNDIVVAKDSFPVVGDLFYVYIDMQVAADGAPTADITVVKENDQPIVATRGFTIRVEDGQVWNGTLDANGYKVRTTLGSKFGKNLIDEFDWSNGLTLAWNGTCYEVVRDADVVAQFVDADGKVMARFTAAEQAIYSLDTFQPIEKFEIGVNDSIQTYNFGGRAKGEGTFKKLVSVGGENTIQNVDLSYGYAVGGDAGTVIFGNGVRVNLNEAGKGFKTGDVELKVVAGAYFYDPTPYCEEGYTAARRSKGDLSGYYVVYPLGDVEVTVTDADGHHVHYKTLQDAFDLAADGSTIQLFNNCAIYATNMTGKSFTLTSDPNGAGSASPLGAHFVTGGEIVLANGAEMTVSNLTFRTARVVVENGGKLIGMDGLEMTHATDGAVIVKDGGQFVVNGNVQIWDNNGKNVVLENPATGLLLKTLEGVDDAGAITKGHVGIWTENCEAGQVFGQVDAAFPYEFYCDGDITVDEPNVYFTNDRNPTLHHGRGATVNKDGAVAVSPTNSVRWANGFTDLVFEGQELLVREGNELVWLDQQDAPLAEKLDCLGGTYGTITLTVNSGCDYALVCEGSTTNWVSMNATTAPNNIHVFENLDPTTQYTVLKRKSITQDAMVSPFVEISGEYWTAKYTAADIPAWFDDSRTYTSGTVGTKTEKAWNDVVEVTVAADGLGYFIKLIKDSNRGANIPTDAGVLTIDMDGLYLRTTTLADDNGIAFLDPDAPEFNYESPKADYDATFKTRLTVINGANGQEVSNITGSSAAGESGAAGTAGIENATDHLVYVTLREGVQVCGGNGGSGSNRTAYMALAGGDGAAAITGEITLTVNGATLKGGSGAKGGDSTNGVGGKGGAGGPAIGAGVTGDIITGTLIGGNGGNGGNVEHGSNLGEGGDGGNCIVNRAAVTFDQDHQYDGTIVLIPGKGGQGDPAGADGEAGKPAAPEAPTIKYLTGNSVTLNVKPGVQYTIFKTEEGLADSPIWTTAREEQYELTFKNLTKDTDYTVLARIPETTTEYESFYSQLDFTTPTYNKADFEEYFPGSSVTEQDGKYVVQLSADIISGVRLPDDLGAFTLNMNQFSIYGTDGQWNLEDYGNGGPAITFTGSGDADQATLTRMTVIGTGANKIVGGKGASPANEVADGEALDGGQGGNGLAVAKDGLRVSNVEVIWVAGELLGGNGGDGADTTNGDAGNGGDGGDAYDAACIEFTLSGGRAVGGNGGNGGDCYRGKAGNGGNGGNAEAGEGGMGGRGGKCLTEGEDGQDGEGGTGIIPGGVSEVYKVKVVDKNGNERFYTTFEAATGAATYGSTIVIIRNCTYDGDDYSELFDAQNIDDSQVADNALAAIPADNVTLTSINDAVLTWNGTLAVGANVSNFVIAAELNVNPTSKGSLYVAGDVTMNGGYVPNLFVANGGKAGLKGGVVWANDGSIGNLWVADGARFIAEVDSQVRVDGVIRAAGYDTVNGIYKDMFLFGGYYGANPEKFVRDPFMVADAKEVFDGKEYFHIVQDPKFAAMVWLDGKIWGVETIDAAFAAILDSSEKIRVDLLKDCEVTTVLNDQNKKIDAEIHGHGHIVTDARTGKKAEQALFNISNNVRFDNVVFDGQGTEAGQFLCLFETSAVVLDGCTVTGYACHNEAKGSYKTLPLISYSSAGEATVFVLRDTVITNNAVSAAISAIDTTGAGFTTHIGVAGATTIEGSGVGILSDAKLQITAIDALTGGWIDVQYEGTGAKSEFGRINIVDHTSFDKDYEYLETTASHFRYVGGKLADRSCGHVVKGDDDLLYLAWEKDVRQYVATITRQGGKVETYATVEDAFADIDMGCTLTLLEDATVERMITAKLPKASYRYTVDLNGKTLTNDGNLLKFGTADVTVKNGTLASVSKYALYVSGADVALEGVTVDCDIYVAKGTLTIDADDVYVKGVIAKTSNGSISITRGTYTQKPAAYLTTLSEAYPINEKDPLYADGYRWYVTAAIEKPGFADGFDLPVTQDPDGNYTIDVSGGDAVGKLREGAKVILPGDLTDRITIKGAPGWIVTATYDETNGKTTVLFEMDREVLKPVLGDTENEEHPFEVQTDGNGNVTYVALRMKNAVRGFYYQLKATDDLSHEFRTVIEKYFNSLDTTDLEFEMKPTTEKFFKLDFSDRSAK